MQEFEKSEELSAHIQRMASTGSTGSTWAWSEFLNVLNKELETLREKYTTIDASNTIKQANIELLEAENAKLIAEREAMVKQKPIAAVVKTTYGINIAVEQHGATGLQTMNVGDYVYASPLPAQQIPDEFNTLIRYNGSKCFDDPREAIDHAMLSASQPKGDV